MGNPDSLRNRNGGQTHHAALQLRGASMSEPSAILVPGEQPAAPAAAAPERKKPGPKPRAAAAPAAAAQTDDDLDDYDSEDLPPAPEGDADFTPAQTRRVQAMIAEAVRASRSSQDPGTAAKLASATLDQQKLPTVEAARAMCDDAVSKGMRPRAVLTTEGWYAHPEMARTKDLGVSRLGGDA